MTVSLGPDAQECELKAVEAESRLGGRDLALKSGPFDTAASALEAGERVLGGLLLTSLRRGFGLSLNARIPTGVVTTYGKKMLAGDQFDTVYDDSYGLVVFEEVGRTGFVSAGVINVRISGPAASLVDSWSAAIADSRGVNERILISYDLWAGARFENSSRARYLLLIMALEALVDQPERTPHEIKLLDGFLASLPEAGLDREQAAALRSGIGMLKRLSIGHSCRLFLDRHIAAGVVSDTGASEHFTKCYKTRGRMVHGGKTPSAVDLVNDANRLEQIAREILIANLEGRAA